MENDYKGVCPKCMKKVTFSDSVKVTAIFTTINCTKCYAPINISKIVIMLSIIGVIPALILGYPIGRMYAYKQISALSIFFLLIFGLIILQIIYYLLLSNSKLKLAKN